MNRWGTALAIGFAALLLTSPVWLQPAWYVSHEGVRYPWLLEHFARTFENGALYPRFLPELMGGYGYPSFVFYQPGWFFLSLPFTWMLSPTGAVKASLVVMFVLGGAGAYKLARLYNSRGVSTALAVLFLCGHYIAVNIHPRGDFTELLAMLLLPWPLFFALKMNRLRDACLLGLSVALVMVSHPFVSLFALPAISLIAFTACRGGRARVSLILSLSAGIVLAMPYWLPALQNMPYVKYQAALDGHYNVFKHLWPAFSVIGSPLQPRFWVLLLALAGCWVGRRRPEIKTAFACLLLCLFLMWEGSAIVWEALFPALQFVQFPWRIQSLLHLVEFLAIAQLGVVWTRWHGRAARPALAAFFAAWAGLALFAADAFNLRISGTSALRPMPYQRLYGFWAGAAVNEFLPVTAILGGLRPRGAVGTPLVERDPFSFARIPPRLAQEASPYNIRFTQNVRQRPALVRVNQFYFPGHALEVNGRRVDFTPPEQVDFSRVSATWDGNGRIRVMLPEAGAYRVRVWYDGPPGWPWRNLVMVALLASLLCALHKTLAAPRSPAKT